MSDEIVGLSSDLPTRKDAPRLPTMPEWRGRHLPGAAKPSRGSSSAGVARLRLSTPRQGDFPPKGEQAASLEKRKPLLCLARARPVELRDRDHAPRRGAHLPAGASAWLLWLARPGLAEDPGAH